MANKKKKRKLTQHQEFEIMKLVLDKFLWIGVVILLFGGWTMYMGGLPAIGEGLVLVIVGIVMLVLFAMLILREYEFLA